MYGVSGMKGLRQKNIENRKILKNIQLQMFRIIFLERKSIIIF